MNGVIVIAELLLRYGPDVAQVVQRWIASGQQPDQKAWDGLFAIARKSADTYRAEAEAELDRKP